MSKIIETVKHFTIKISFKNVFKILTPPPMIRKKTKNFEINYMADWNLIDVFRYVY